MKDKWNLLGLAGLLLLIVGTAHGLIWAPPEKFMGDVGRILYVHVPTAWAALLYGTFAFVAAIGVLWKRTPKWDAALEALVEVSAVLTVMLLIQGSIWAKPTWNAYWVWDPRLTSTAVLGIGLAAIVALRSFVEDPDRKASWSAVGTILAFANILIVYYSVKWWRTQHQSFSGQDDVDHKMALALKINAFAILFIAGWLSARRARLAWLLRPESSAVPAPPASDLVAGV